MSENGAQIVNVIGAGLAGCEAALQLAARGIRVRLLECKPNKRTPAHSSDGLAELVCSNSLKSAAPSTASGLLKAELNVLGCRLLEIAEQVRVPAGSALAVDRDAFSALVTREITENENIELVSREVTDWDSSEYNIIATGPLTLDGLSQSIATRLGEGLHFYDAAAPIVDGSSIDYSRTFTADRYQRGEGDYVNCPLTRDEYEAFVTALVSSEVATRHDFDRSEIFEGCMPVEIMAKRGFDSLRFGPMRPVGFLTDDGKRPYAVLQLRRENSAGDSYNLVGCQTSLKFGEQERVFRLIPALKNAEFLRYGVMHRNTFINAPLTIQSDFRTIKEPKTFIAGQLSGVEGYVESIASGLVAALSLAAEINKTAPPHFPATTIIGALCRYLTTPNPDFQPMNANFGLLPPLDTRKKDKAAKKLELYERSLKDLKNADF